MSTAETADDSRIEHAARHASSLPAAARAQPPGDPRPIAPVLESTIAQSTVPAPATHEFDLFIIHAATDAVFVREYLLPALELPSDRVLLVDELPLGGLVVSEIDRGVSRSRYTVAVLSPAYLEDRWADFGVELASHLSLKDARVIPLRLIDCEPPARLEARIALDFTDKGRWQWETARLRELLRTPAPTA